MTKKYYLMVTLVALLVVIVLVFLNFLYQGNRSHGFTEVTGLFMQRKDEFMDIAEQFKSRGPGEFCKYTKGYEFDGDFFNVDNGRYFVGGGPLGDDVEVTYNQLLENVSLTHDEFLLFKHFLDQNLYVQCLVGIVGRTYTGIEFRLPYLSVTNKVKGFLYVYEGDPQPDTYTRLEAISDDKWFIFEKK